jgi:hypothetical protein
MLLQLTIIVKCTTPEKLLRQKSKSLFLIEKLKTDLNSFDCKEVRLITFSGFSFLRQNKKFSAKIHQGRQQSKIMTK